MWVLVRGFVDNGCFWNLSIMGLGDPDLSVLSVQGVLGEGQEVRVAVDIEVGRDTVMHHGSVGVMVMVVHHRSGVKTSVVVVERFMVVHCGWQRLNQVVIQMMIQMMVQMVIIVHQSGTVSQMDAIRMMDLSVQQMRQFLMVVTMMAIHMGQKTWGSLGQSQHSQDAHEELDYTN